MEPRPDGRGKKVAGPLLGLGLGVPQWSPGLMAGGRSAHASSAATIWLPQWSPGLMAGGRGVTYDLAGSFAAPQWSPGLMAGGSQAGRTEGQAGRTAAMEPRPDGRGKSAMLYAR